MMNYMYYHQNYFPAFGFLGIILQIAWWALIIWLLIAVIRHFTGHNYHRDDFSKTTDTALDILRQRYVKGEITKKEFDSMKKDIA